VVIPTGSLTKIDRKGTKANPRIVITNAIPRYAFLNNFIKARILGRSPVATGLYKLKLSAVEMPRSAKDNTERTFVYRPFTPKYVTPIV
jgi:hypothetical protein